MTKIISRFHEKVEKGEGEFPETVYVTIDANESLVFELHARVSKFLREKGFEA